ncbi:phage tail tape measure protein [Photobacterium sp. CAU 1568]|uniref:Phage tail tape measure protein n=1 Tax=Photobacterium arenosum TaxID=2774143 RepID=A0ABR9BTI7_9GAMM|nr:phage tail tape measure protein [Photobacterium arenosum]MBD8515165.1 phage tail tape measure protein [Photobacterium arenosum]
MALPEPLRFTVGLIDQISKPLGNIQRQFGDMARSYRDGTHTMVAGAAGVAGAGIALQQALMPAIEMDRALGEVKSLGVADKQLQQLSDTALSFAVEYGKSATEFVAASYDIKSAMGAMSGDELSGVTRSSAILAAATKADTATITSYMGTMYSVFKDQADAIGKDNWAERIAGMTSKSVEMFKTTGQGMSDAFKGIGALGKANGIAMQEQMAVLGMLQGSMSGSEAGTRYKAFLSGVVKAQDALGMSFVDSNGKMLPMFEIMGKLKERFGELDSAEIHQLKTAFGSDQATLVITDLIKKTGELKGNISELDKASNLNTAINMAHAMTDQWERLESGVFAVRAAIGAALLPAILPLVAELADGANTLIEWTQLFPNLTRVIGYGVIAVLSLAAAGGMLTLMVGIGKQAMAMYTLTLNLWGIAAAGLTKTMMFLRGAVLAANLAIAANPIILIVGAVVAAIAAVGALIYYWDDLKASFGDTTWFQILENAIALFTLPFRAAFALVRAGWQWVMSGFTDASGFEFIGQMAGEIYNIFGGVFEWLKSMWEQIGTTMKGMIDWLPGFGGDEEAVSIQAVQAAKPVAQVPHGGAAKTLSNYQSSSTNYGGVSIYAQQMNNPQDFANEMEMFAG